MPAPTLTPTVTGISQTAARWRISVDSVYDPAVTTWTPTWVEVFGVVDLAPGVVEYSTADDTDYDGVDASGLVWASNKKVGASWKLSGTVATKKYGAARDPGAALLEDRCNSNTAVHVRWYDRFGTVAFEGYGDCNWIPQSGKPTDLSQAQFEVLGKGSRTAITNPVASFTVPDAVSVLPTTGPAGTAVVITGTNFVGIVPTTGVKFGSNNAALFHVDSDTQITAVVPVAGTAGSQPITVTNGAGADATTVAFTKS